MQKSLWSTLFTILCLVLLGTSAIQATEISGATCSTRDQSKSLSVGDLAFTTSEIMPASSFSAVSFCGACSDHTCINTREWSFCLVPDTGEVGQCVMDNLSCGSIRNHCGCYPQP